MTYRPGADNDLGALAAEAPTDDKGKSKKKDKKEKKPTRKVVDRQLIVAAGFAILVVIGTFLYLNRPEEGVYVVRANADIPALTPMTVDLTEAVLVPEEDVVSGAFSSTSSPRDALIKANEAFQSGARASGVINSNQQITPSMLSGIEGISETLEPNERLVSVSADIVAGVSGKIGAGDYVDIFATARGTGDDVTGLLVSNVPVVSVSAGEDLYRQAQSRQQAADETGQNPGTLLPANPVAPGIYVLRVDESVVPSLIANQVSGKLFLAYRGNDPESGALNEVEPLTAIEAICNANPNNTSAACLEVAAPGL